MNKTSKEIKKFENFLGFSVSKIETTIESDRTHDETISFNVCQKFYRKNERLKKAIHYATAILAGMLKENNKNEDNVKKIEFFYSLIGNMYYVLGESNHAAGYFMKCLSYNKNDISYWVELLFSLRSMGKFKLFETGIFNFEKLCLFWKNDSEKEMTQEKVLELIKKINE